MAAPSEEAPRPRIMVVDDSADFVELVSEDLASQGYDVIPAFSGEECLVKASAAPPDVVLLDVSMPGLNGLETCIRLRQSPATECVPIIFMTGYNAAEGSALATVAAGGDDFIEKPYRAPILFARVAAHLQSAQRTRRLAYIDDRGYAGCSFWRSVLDRELLRARRNPGATVAVAALRPRVGADLTAVRAALPSFPGHIARLDICTMQDGALLVLLCDRVPRELAAWTEAASAVARGRVVVGDGADDVRAEALVSAALAQPTENLVVIGGASEHGADRAGRA